MASLLVFSLTVSALNETHKCSYRLGTEDGRCSGVIRSEKEVIKSFFYFWQFNLNFNFIYDYLYMFSGLYISIAVMILLFLTAKLLINRSKDLEDVRRL